MTISLKTEICTTSLREYCTLNQTCRRIEIYSLHCAYIWTRLNRQLITSLVSVVLATYNLNINLWNPAFAYCHLCKFAHCQSMYNRNRYSTNERLMLLFEDRTIYIHSVWIWTVKYNQSLSLLGKGIKGPQHCNIIGEETNTYILYVEYQNIKLLCLLRSHTASFSVK